MEANLLTASLSDPELLGICCEANDEHPVAVVFSRELRGRGWGNFSEQALGTRPSFCLPACWLPSSSLEGLQEHRTPLPRGPKVTMVLSGKLDGVHSNPDSLLRGLESSRYRIRVGS